MLYVDAHEFGLSDYFFRRTPIRVPRDPRPGPRLDQQPYSTAISAEFNREGIKFFHGAPYDFFAIVFGDTVPATGFMPPG
jgi:hypothetical protein